MNSAAYIAGTGSYLPADIVTNEELANIIGLTPHDIEKRTGIRERRRAKEGEATSDLATHAAFSALHAAGIDAADVGLIVLSTTSPDMFMPSTACLVQKNIGAKKAAAFDVNASCSGFLYALNIAETFIKNGQVDTALIIAAEVKTRFVYPADKETAILFGDGAGAVVLRNKESKNNPPLPVAMLRSNGNPAPLEKGGKELQVPPFNKGGIGGIKPPELVGQIIGTWLYADGTNWNWIHLPAGGTRIPSTLDTIAANLHTMRMDGGKVYRAAIKTLESLITDTIKKSGLRLEEIDTFLFHQANLRIIKQVATRLGIPEKKVPITITHTGNTSSASIPITLNQLVREGRIKEGDTVLLASFGGGLTWGASIIKWTTPNL
ncbi:MAG: ketoacyl-ACP synthase III [Nitrospirae bacterium]|nr:ketoacyl-ACP synthase III [Nitrospirota bacterium]